jgi:hypothetical protein
MRKESTRDYRREDRARLHQTGVFYFLCHHADPDLAETSIALDPQHQGSSLLHL